MKTSSTKSAELRKGVVKVDSGSRNKAEPVGKYELDRNEIDDGEIDSGEVKNNEVG